MQRGQMSGAGAHNPELVQGDPAPEKPDKAATKAYTNGMKYLAKAHELEDQASKSADAEKKAVLSDKVGDAYGRALDYFTEVLRNKPSMYDAWSRVGYIHYRLGAYRESIDDYNHALALKPDVTEAIRYRAEANLSLDRLEEARYAYLDLAAHDPAQAQELLAGMRKWLQSHRAASNGVRPADIDAFDKWLQERGAAATAATGE